MEKEYSVENRTVHSITGAWCLLPVDSGVYGGRKPELDSELRRRPRRQRKLLAIDIRFTGCQEYGEFKSDQLDLGRLCDGFTLHRTHHGQLYVFKEVCVQGHRYQGEEGKGVSSILTLHIYKLLNVLYWPPHRHDLFFL